MFSFIGSAALAVATIGVPNASTANIFPFGSPLQVTSIGGFGINTPVGNIPVGGGFGINTPVGNIPVGGGFGINTPVGNIPVGGGFGINTPFVGMYLGTMGVL